MQGEIQAEMEWLQAQLQETRSQEQVKACKLRWCGEVRRVAQAEPAGITRGDCEGLEEHLSLVGFLRHPLGL